MTEAGLFQKLGQHCVNVYHDRAYQHTVLSERGRIGSISHLQFCKAYGRSDHHLCIYLVFVDIIVQTGRIAIQEESLAAHVCKCITHGL